MTQKSQKQSDSTEQITVEDVDHYDELTEEEFERSTDSLQVRHLLATERHRAYDRNDVEVLLNIHLGHDDWNNYRTLKVFRIPDGYHFKSEDEANLEMENMSDEFKPEPEWFAMEIKSVIEFIQNDNKYDMDDYTDAYRYESIASENNMIQEFTDGLEEILADEFEN